jgi:glycosyltransferase involved in cell wall biosynthesis
MSNPKVTVLMLAYNAEKFVGESIESILNQTFTDFEFVIVYDESPDNTDAILKSYAEKDSRIRLVKNRYSKGIPGASNTGLEEAKGEYIARMDSDDISLPTRLEKEVRFLDEHPEFGVVGSWVELIGQNKGTVWKLQTDPEFIKATMLFYGAIANPTSVIRKSILDKYKFTYKDVPAEDFDLFVRLSEVTKLTNLPEILFHYRTHEVNTHKVISTKLRDSANAILKYQFSKLVPDASEHEIDMHNRIANWAIEDSVKFIADTRLWFSKLLTANKSKKIYDQTALANKLALKWLDVYLMTNRFAKGEVTNFLKSNIFVNASTDKKMKITAGITKQFFKQIKKKIK